MLKVGLAIQFAFILSSCGPSGGSKSPLNEMVVVPIPPMLLTDSSKFFAPGSEQTSLSLIEEQTCANGVCSLGSSASNTDLTASQIDPTRGQWVPESSCSNGTCSAPAAQGATCSGGSCSTGSGTCSTGGCSTCAAGSSCRYATSNGDGTLTATKFGVNVASKNDFTYTNSGQPYANQSSFLGTNGQPIAGSTLFRPANSPVYTNQIIPTTGLGIPQSANSLGALLTAFAVQLQGSSGVYTPNYSFGNVNPTLVGNGTYNPNAYRQISPNYNNPTALRQGYQNQYQAQQF